MLYSFRVVNTEIRQTYDPVAVPEMLPQCTNGYRSPSNVCDQLINLYKNEIY